MVSRTLKVTFDNLVRNPQNDLTINYAYSFRHLECYIENFNKATEIETINRIFLLNPAQNIDIKIERVSDNLPQTLAENVHVLWALSPIERASLLYKMKNVGDKLKLYKVSYRKSYEIIPELISQLISK